MHEVFRDVDLQRQFDRDGMVIVDLFDEEKMAEIASIWEANPHGLDGITWYVTNFLSDISFRYKVSNEVDGAVGSRLRSVLNDYTIDHFAFIAKHPGKDGEIPFHFHPTNVDEARFTGVSMFCPLVETNVENGCLRVVKGSHQFNLGQRWSNLVTHDLVPELCEEWITDAPTKPGQAIFFHNRLIHGSRPNMSRDVRPVLAMAARPSNSQLRFVRLDDAGEQVEVFEVEDDFYMRYNHFIQMPQPSGEPVAVCEKGEGLLSADELADALSKL